MKRKILGVLMAVIMGVGFVMPVGAASMTGGVLGGEGRGLNPVVGTFGGIITEATDSSCEKRFLGFRPWYAGLVTKKDQVCTVGTPAKDKMPAFVWTIVLNILADLFAALGLAATVYAIYGGFKYIMSEGDPGKLAGAKKILINAVIGVAIALLAGVIVNTIITVLQGALS